MMQPMMQRPGMAVAELARAGSRYGTAFVGNGSWSVRSCFITPNTDHKATSPGRSPVIPW
jgi:hypothetical protein